jgi:hypothetical protein
MTGGGFPENIPRVVPKGLQTRIDRSAWGVPELFQWLQKVGLIVREAQDSKYNVRRVDLPPLQLCGWLIALQGLSAWLGAQDAITTCRRGACQTRRCSARSIWAWAWWWWWRRSTWTPCWRRAWGPSGWVTSQRAMVCNCWTACDIVLCSTSVSENADVLTIAVGSLP